MNLYSRFVSARAIPGVTLWSYIDPTVASTESVPVPDTQAVGLHIAVASSDNWDIV